MKRVLVGGGSLGLALLASSCGPAEAGAAKLKHVSVGITRDSVRTVLGSGPLTASGNDAVRVEQGYRFSRFLSEGQMFEVVYVRDEPGDVSEPLRKAKETPIVFSNDTVISRGWKQYRKLAARYAFPLPPEDEGK